MGIKMERSLFFALEENSDMIITHACHGLSSRDGRVLFVYVH